MMVQRSATPRTAPVRRPDVQHRRQLQLRRRPMPPTSTWRRARPPGRGGQLHGHRRARRDATPHADDHADRHQRCAGGGGRRGRRPRKTRPSTVNVLANDSDVDDGHVFTLSTASAPSGKVAGLTSVANGSYSFDPGNAAYQHLARGRDRAGRRSTTRCTDEHGATCDSTLTITVTGTNDAPVAVADINSGTEDTHASPARSRPTTATSMTARR